MKKLNLLHIIVLLVILQGCVSTIIEPKQPLSGIYHLGKIAKNRINLETYSTLDSNAQSDNKSVGSQFLFVFIPFGDISLSHPDKMLFESASRILGLQHIGIEQNREIFPKLKFELQDLQLTAYDFIFGRRIVCKVSIKATYEAASGEEYTVVYKGKDAKLAQFAFKQDLGKVLEGTIDATITRALEEFNLIEIEQVQD